MEREGVPEVDRLASRIRLAQLDIIFDGIVSRYNRWKRGGFLQRGEHRRPESWETFERYEPLWVLTGDFNATPKSVEYQTILNMNFLDVVTNKGGGTKAPGAGNPPTLTLDYVFAGPAFVSLDPLVLPSGILNNQVHYELVSDHLPMIANVPVWA
jgi:endonuclease/exonuclease/phosphatase family metal-dependent hydrolase